MGLIDGLRGNWSDDEVRHIANNPLSWIVKAESLQKAGDCLRDQIIPSLRNPEEPDTIFSHVEEMKVAPLLTPMNLLYGFAIENILKGIYINAHQNFDFLTPNDLKCIWTHNLRYLHTLVATSLPLEDWELNLLDDLTIIITAQGRYPAGKPTKDKDSNTHPIGQIREFSTFVSNIVTSGRTIITLDGFSTKPSPLGRVAYVYGSNTEAARIAYESLGIPIVENPKEQSLKDQYKD